MGHSLNMKIVAEGVETTDQADFLRKLGCDEMQGYLIGRPQPTTMPPLRSTRGLVKRCMRRIRPR